MTFEPLKMAVKMKSVFKDDLSPDKKSVDSELKKLNASFDYDIEDSFLIDPFVFMDSLKGATGGPFPMFPVEYDDYVIQYLAIKGTLEDISLPVGAKIGCLIRSDEEIVFPGDKDTIIHAGNSILVFAASKSIQKVENLFGTIG